MPEWAAMEMLFLEFFWLGVTADTASDLVAALIGMVMLVVLAVWITNRFRNCWRSSLLMALLSTIGVLGWLLSPLLMVLLDDVALVLLTIPELPLLVIAVPLPLFLLLPEVLEGLLFLLFCITESFSFSLAVSTVKAARGLPLESLLCTSTGGASLDLLAFFLDLLSSNSFCFSSDSSCSLAALIAFKPSGSKLLLFFAVQVILFKLSFARGVEALLLL
mmetsp:Transcript_17770/g.24377  ORF Transcript_17770/g.24377 Transcript_17770/m.24377 type:complete len:219 (-) Transcript_17770:2473-3129(-)